SVPPWEAKGFASARHKRGGKNRESKVKWRLKHWFGGVRQGLPEQPGPPLPEEPPTPGPSEAEQSMELELASRAPPRAEEQGRFPIAGRALLLSAINERIE
ncbi:unnamed protein product, partial [Prorocentrum cordatum]